MYNHQEDIDLLERMDQKRYPKCFYCPDKPLYTQPDKSTGKIVDVCDKHFIFKHMA